MAILLMGKVIYESGFHLKYFLWKWYGYTCNEIQKYDLYLIVETNVQLHHSIECLMQLLQGKFCNR